MSEEQNDSPAFRLRPRRAAPKSYYTVRLEYSANPAAFIRERPRSASKRKVFSQKSGSNTTKYHHLQPTGQHGATSAAVKPTIVSKEDQELEERKLRLVRSSSESIITNAMISPFIQSLPLEELKPESVYEHNYISLNIKHVQKSASCQRILECLCQGASGSGQGLGVRVLLHDEYADSSLVKPGKMISIAKFKTDDFSGDSEASSLSTLMAPLGDRLPFNVIVKLDELVERSTCNSNKGNSSATASSSFGVTAGGASVSRRQLIPFVSITDMIEEPEEPYVELAPQSPTSSFLGQQNHDHENLNT